MRGFLNEGQLDGKMSTLKCGWMGNRRELICWDKQIKAFVREISFLLYFDLK